MEQVVSVLPYLACPLGMGVMMWLMMRGNKGEAADASPAPVQRVAARQPEAGAAQSAPSSGTLRLGRLCLNWKVAAGLAAVGLGIWAVAPGLIGVALPLLLVAACPLSMLFMARGMQGGPCAAQPERQAQAERLVAAGGPREQQLAELKVHLAATQAQQEAIAHQIAWLEADDTAAVRQAEEVARAASEHGRTAS